MKYLVSLLTLLSFSLAAPGIPNSFLLRPQGPDAHMNPKCGQPSTSHTPPVPPSDTGFTGGTYAVEGTTPEGSTYTGTALISGDASAGFQVQWTIGDSQYSGTGTLAGDTLTVDWGAPEPVVYKIADGGAMLKGKWGKRGKGREKLTRQ
jgi:hypothetical protein